MPFDQSASDHRSLVASKHLRSPERIGKILGLDVGKRDKGKNGEDHAEAFPILHMSYGHRPRNNDCRYDCVSSQACASSSLGDGACCE